MIVRLMDAADAVREITAPWAVPGLRARWFRYAGLRFDAAAVDDAGVWTYRSQQTWPEASVQPIREGVVVNTTGAVIGRVPIVGVPDAVDVAGVTCPLWCVRNQQGQVEYRHG